ncbi:hypothetical protein BGX33_005092 [Mortierella sp. NVP41]|nr:hypothetical protein BGX33_005092 [Mortierella sp. NVP41]
MPDLSRHLIRGGSRHVYLPRMDSWPQQILESGFSIRNDDSLPSDSFVHPLQLSIRYLQDPFPGSESCDPTAPATTNTATTNVDRLHSLGPSAWSFPTLLSASTFHSSSTPDQSIPSTNQSSPPTTRSTLLSGSHRRRLTPNETEYLLRQYRINEKPNTKDRLIFAAHLDLHPRTIQVWFQNRRAKLRREDSQARRLLEEYNQMRAHDDESYGSNTEDGLDEDNRAFDNLCDLDSGSSSGDSSTHETDFGQSGQAQQYQWKTRESDDKAMPEAAAGLYNHQEAQTSLLDPQFRQSRDITNAFLGPFYSDLAWAWQVGDGSYAGGVSSNQARPGCHRDHDNFSTPEPWVCDGSAWFSGFSVPGQQAPVAMDGRGGLLLGGSSGLTEPSIHAFGSSTRSDMSMMPMESFPLPVPSGSIRESALTDAAPPVHVPKRSTVDAKILSNSRQRRSQLRHKIKINDRGSSRSVSQDKGIATTRRARSQFLFEPQQKGRIPNHQRALTLVSSTSESHPSI